MFAPEPVPLARLPASSKEEETGTVWRSGFRGFEGVVALVWARGIDGKVNGRLVCFWLNINEF